MLALQRTAGNAAACAVQRKTTKASLPPKNADLKQLVHSMWPKVDYMWKTEHDDADPMSLRQSAPDL